MSLASNSDRARRALNRQVTIGLAAVAVTLTATGTWAALGTIQDAVMAPGVVTVNTQKKKVQHPDGGIISEIDAQDGMHVEQGALMFRLDGKQLNADVGVVKRRIFELTAKKWRLLAERDSAASLGVQPSPPANNGEGGSDVELTEIVAGQKQLFETKKTVLQQQKLQLGERISQLDRQVDGLVSVKTARTEQLTIARDELAKLSELAQKGLVPVTRWTPVQREVAQLVGDIGQTDAEIAKARGQIAELNLKLIEADESYRKDALDELQSVDGELSQLVERRLGLEAKLQHLEVRAPVSGRVHELSVHTIGGVVSAGDTLAYIIPDHDELVVDALVPPREIDRIREGAPARLRFTSFDRTVTPEVNGHVLWISADQEIATEGKPAAFKVRIAIGSDEIKRLGAGASISPGMEVETMFTGPQRNVISYVVKPITDQLQRTFRER